MEHSIDKKEWIWPQANGQTFRVVSHPKKGYIKVYNEKNEIVLEHKNLSPEQVKLIENQFLSVVTNDSLQQNSMNTEHHDPMIS